MTVHETLSAFFMSYPSISVKKDKLMLQPDAEIPHIFYLTEGYVRMYRLLEDGKELTITIFKPDSFFPLFLALDNVENTYYFEAFTNCVVKKIATGEMIRFMTSNQEVLLDFTRRTSRGMQGILENLQYQLFGTVTQRTVSTLVMLANRFGTKKGVGMHILLPISHQDIANFVGVARESISIEMKRLEKRALIKTAYKHIDILDLQGLVLLRDTVE
jgi:CRP/FNR family transcriptional regulator